MKAKPIIIGAVVVALVAILAYDVVKKDDHALERVSERVGLAVNCKILKQDGKSWGVCRYKNGAPASVWLDRDATWIAANGNAIEVVGKLANVQDLQNLPAVMVDYQSPPTMPGALLEQ
jgi:hypothetical protein